ncbi:hypothetical protein [Sphingosinicella sp. BN140058]|uniref:hypothetical protein n=1 Tax=Sphingosinicella sp. BN140058 TaxID=1892855 RepID=UPI0013EB8C66|nr:hypothetical protein [Sphingosinicella sp. BN140058]
MRSARRLFAFPLPLLLAAAAPPDVEQRSLVDQAAAAYGVYDVNRAEALYRRAAEDPKASPADRGVARREAARIAWLVDGDAATARRLLDRGIGEDPDPCPAALLYARILNAQVAAGDGPIDGLALRCRAVEPGVAVERARARMLAAAGAREGRPALVRAAEAAWAALPADARSSPAGARLRLALGLLAGDGAGAYAGWRSYFGLAPGEDSPQALQPLLSDAMSVFRRGAAIGGDPRDRLALALLLMRTGFDEELRGFIADAPWWQALGDQDPGRRTIGAYLRLRASLDAAVLAHDRHYARHGASNEDQFEQGLTSMLSAAVAELGSTGPDPWPELRRHFNLFGTIGKSNGVSSLHLGHVVVDAQRSVTQDGRSGTLRFIAIDTMAQNGFSGWLADGAGGPGGWAVEGTTIVQVRPRFMATVETSLALARPGEARDRALRETARKRASDRAIAAAEPIAFLPGVRDRLRLQGIDDIVAQVRGAGTPEAEFAAAFRKAYSEATFGSAILAHEGRHALDQVEFTGTHALANDELEYRAKLSEIAFAASPRLALSSIYGPLFGGSSGHGIANRRLAADLAAWIRAHPDEVAAYDAGLTPLEQLDRLSNDQLRAIVRGLDARLRSPIAERAPIG